MEGGDEIMAFWIYRDTVGQWRWYLSAANNKKIANSGEGYWNYQDCVGAIQLVQGSHSSPVYNL
jgi:uncharacterized protein YegP (UPF0339 family)